MDIALGVSRGLPFLCSCIEDGKLSSNGCTYSEPGSCVDYSNSHLICLITLKKTGIAFIILSKIHVYLHPSRKGISYSNFHFLRDMENSSVISLMLTLLQSLFCFPHSSLWTLTYRLNTWVCSIWESSSTLHFR